MNFEYKLTGLGWADGFIEVKNNTCYFTASYITNALEDFLRSLISIIPACVPEDELKQQATFEFYAEPAGTLWTLKRVTDDKITIQITQYKDIDHKHEPSIGMDVEINLNEFLGVVIKELELLVRTHGIVGFRECWYYHDFPLTFFLKLKNYYITQSSYNVTEYEEKGCQLVKTNIDSDIQLLFSEI